MSTDEKERRVNWEFDENESAATEETPKQVADSGRIASGSDRAVAPIRRISARVTYSEFFESITGRPPFPYQLRLGTEPWPELLDVPTGLGKTAAAIVAWLYKRLTEDSATGMRLAYCLPMRVLVEQTGAAARDWCSRAAGYFEGPPPTVHVLMGGDVDDAWENHPERPAILVGTQDILLSRALNRGYALSRYKWPVHFALLNNDCSWVFDETQLVGVGIETSAQLAGLREKLGAHESASTMWMSATLGERQLDTVDHRKPAEGWRQHRLGSDDFDDDVVRARVRATKPIRKLNAVRLDKEGDKNGTCIAELADRVLAEHEKRGGLTLVIVNRVARAQAVYEALLRRGRTAGNTALVHSRYRLPDRERQEAILHDVSRERIVVATQAVEAGVDVSARTLFTELAPWPSLVQRFGRCNRYGEEAAAIFWLEIDTEDDKSGLQLPYSTTELVEARVLLERLAAGGADAGPQTLKEIDYSPPAVVRPVIRRRDLLDLFDTTPDLSGNDIDISRYVRDGDDADLQVYWRDFDEPSPPVNLRQPARDELCRVSIAAARDFLDRLEKHRKKLGSGTENIRRMAAQLQAWRWNALDKQWENAKRAYPGQILLLHSSAGGYRREVGWTGEVGPKFAVAPEEVTAKAAIESEAYGSDPDTVVKRWVLLSDHLGHVRDEAWALAGALHVSDFSEALATAGLWHDVGKAHDAFQRKLLGPVETRVDLRPSGDGPWAKSNHRLQSVDARKHFRHEIASALAWLTASNDAEMDPELRDLVAYLVAAHHGKVRLSLRSLPGETEPQDPGRLFARGVWDGDVLPAFELPDGRRFEGVTLDLSLMRLGEGSWLERMLVLRDAKHLGPFRLALLETIVRVADWRASRKEEEGAYDA